MIFCSTYINKICATIIEKISDLSKKLRTFTFPDLIGTPIKVEKIGLAMARKSALPGSSARIILSASNSAYIGLICW